MTKNQHAIEHFSHKLRFETDPSDVYAAWQSGSGLVLVDSRGEDSWRQGRAANAVHLPTAMIAEKASELIPRDSLVVVYCWGPGCNGAAKAALEFARLGYQVKEMTGGFEYWAREGFPVLNDDGPVVRQTDPLTAPLANTGISCDC